jgi:hypothetical protein
MVAPTIGRAGESLNQIRNTATKSAAIGFLAFFIRNMRFWPYDDEASLRAR